MAKKLLINLSIISITASAIYLSIAAEQTGFRERLVESIEKAAGTDRDSVKDKENSVYVESGDNSSGYKSGDWYEYTYDKESYKYLQDTQRGNVYSGDNVKIDSYGTAAFNMKYGKSYFTSKKYKQYDTDTPQSKIIVGGFMPEQLVQLHVEGEAGDRVTVFIDHDSARQNNENKYMLKYKAMSEDELLQEVNAGDIDIKFNQSKYAVYDNTDKQGLGMDFTLKRNSFVVKAFGSVARGETAIDYFRGNSSQGNTKLADYQYIRKTYYQLEPFVRYDNVSSIPSGSSVYSLVTLTSAPASPASYTLTPVNISTDGFELYMDDQNQYNNYNAIQLAMDNGYYTRLVNGTDYTINYTTGVIRFIRDVPDNARIFAVYNRTGGTLDPCAIPPGDTTHHPGGSFAGRIFVFIKYGYSINEDLNRDFVYSATLDKNGDGRLNLDIYEIRSYYYLGSRNIMSGSLAFEFQKENSVIPDSEKTSLSTYSIVYTEGIFQFSLREPFRPLLGSTSAAYIYSENKLTSSYSYSRYSIKADFNVEAKSFQLGHSNLVEKSVRVKVNSRELSSSLYSVDYTSGYLSFTDPNNPVIGSDTQIEIKYEYYPFGRSEGNFIGGVRSDYNITRDLRIGGSVLYSKDAESKIIPDVGDEAQSTLLFEGDATLKLTQKRLTELFRSITGGSRKTVPAELTLYAEHAKSIKDMNTYGKGLIDNMESSDETVSVSLSEKDWQLASMPSGYGQSQRGILYYYFYRDPGSPDSLRGTDFTPYAVPYGVKPGPFNIATGHVDSSIMSQDSQRSLVFDLNLTSGTCFSVVTRNLSDSTIDLSGVQYIELWVRYEGGTGNIQLGMDLGSVNEDSDGDGTLDTEDANRNGYIDSEPSSGYSEDRGYAFNGNNATVVGSGPGLSSSTKGDGVLNTEDLNNNGVLDTSDRVYSVDLGTIASATSGWQKIRIYVDRSTLTSSELDILKQVKSLRFYGVGAAGTTGRLFIDSMKLITAKWKDPELNGIAVSDPGVIKLTMVDTINDSDYHDDSFLLKETGVYESLYGSDSTDDIGKRSEAALQMEYNIPAGGVLTVTRHLSKNMDIRFYNTLDSWINVRSISAGNYVSYILGSSDNDYVEFRTAPGSTMQWLDIAMKLTGKSSGNVEKYSVTGSPDMRRIKYIRLKITGDSGSATSGKIWFNDMYVSDPEDQKGTAKWYECNLRILEPFFKTSGGTPVLSNMDLKYIYKSVSSSFDSPNRIEKDISEKYHEFYSSTRIIPNWSASADYIREYTVSDSIDEKLPVDKRGRVSRNFILLNSAFASTGGMVPSVSVSYTMDSSEAERDLEVSGTDYEETAEKTSHAPVISITEEFPNFLFGKLTARIMMNMLFTENRSERGSDNVSDLVLSGYVPLRETEKKQKADSTVQLDYISGGFYLKPQLALSSNEVVEWEGKSNSLGISDTLKGDYHIPFIPARDMKYLERNNGISLTTGYTSMDYISPEYKAGFSYRENGFEDYTSSIVENNDSFSRSKNTVSNFTTGINIPILLKKFKPFNNVKHCQIGYTRDITLTESDVPYEGENQDYLNEKYGISRVFSDLSGDALNLFVNYPGINFKGRGNYARGRDLIYKSMNTKLDLMETNSTVDYDNALKLDEKFTADITMNFDIADITLTGNMNQLCERGNLYGIPNQVVSWQTGFNATFDLMKIFSFGFFRENGSGLPYHAASISAGFNYTDDMLITENIDEIKMSPNLGLTFKIDRSSFGFKSSLDYRKRKSQEFIDYDTPSDDPDYIYISNMEGNNSFSEKDNGYKFTAFYETDVKWIYDYFSEFYKLNGLPIFTLEYDLEIDRYDYTKTVSPEPYDLHMVKSGLTLDLHKNVKGGMAAAAALEKFRNRENNGISREVVSYEISGNITLIF